MFGLTKNLNENLFSQKKTVFAFPCIKDVLKIKTFILNYRG